MARLPRRVIFAIRRKPNGFEKRNRRTYPEPDRAPPRFPRASRSGHAGIPHGAEDRGRAEIPGHGSAQMPADGRHRRVEGRKTGQDPLPAFRHRRAARSGRDGPAVRFREPGRHARLRPRQPHGLPADDRPPDGEPPGRDPRHHRVPVPDERGRRGRPGHDRRRRAGGPPA